MPYGEFETVLQKTESKIIIPNAVRNSIPSRIVRMYLQFCLETGHDVTLSAPTMFRILAACPASTKKSMKGVDEYRAMADEAFQNLFALCEKLNYHASDATWAMSTISALKLCAEYLKADFRVHLEQRSNIIDHCISCALSSPNTREQTAVCNSAHILQCDRCILLDNTLNSIENILRNSTFASIRDQEESFYLYEKAFEGINNFKSHQVRAVNQEKAKIDVLNQLTPNFDCLLMMDWSMKILPLYHKETQQQWYAKRGFSMHCTVVYRKTESSFATKNFVHILADDTDQSSATVIAILRDVVIKLKHEMPLLRCLMLKADNAGCYHSIPTTLQARKILKHLHIYFRILRIPIF